MPDLRRHAEQPLHDLLQGFRALVVNGPRQSGKSTLVRRYQSEQSRSLITLDDAVARDLAVHDPVGFVERLEFGAAIDEFQRGGDALLLALKSALDLNKLPGQFLLAGSTQFLAMRTITETLTGRVGILELLPLSAGELRGTREQFLERAFSQEFDGAVERLDRADYADQIAQGGFPELALGPHNQRFHTAWCSAYLSTVTAAANVEQVAHIRRPGAMVDLLSQVAARTGSELVRDDVARDTLLSPDTAASYLDVLASLYLVRRIPAWTTSQTTRAKKRAKWHLVDTGLAAHLLSQGRDDLSRLDSPWFGPLLESYVALEIAKQATWHERPVNLGHYRDRDGREIDLVLERGRDLVGIEVKATSTPQLSHAKHLVFLRDRVGDRFKAGIVLHTGQQVVRLGDRVWAMPVSALWQ